MNESARAVVLSVLVAACSCSAVAADLAGWSLEFAGARRRGATYSLTVVDGALVLRVAQTGTYIFVR